MGGLVEHQDFALPGRKELLKSDMEYEVVVVDSTETPVERSKKATNLVRKEKEAYTENTSSAGKRK